MAKWIVNVSQKEGDKKILSTQHVLVDSADYLYPSIRVSSGEEYEILVEANTKYEAEVDALRYLTEEQYAQQAGAVEGREITVDSGL